MDFKFLNVLTMFFFFFLTNGKSVVVVSKSPPEGLDDSRMLWKNSAYVTGLQPDRHCNN